MNKIICLSHFDFNEECKKNGWSDGNIPPGTSFISIIGTPDCINYYMGTKLALDSGPFASHWFKSEASGKVCNVEFDDIAADFRDWKGHRFYGLNMEQAKKIVEFIERNRGDDFYIHCFAGQSRSQGVMRFIQDTYPEYESNIPFSTSTPNFDVVSKLKRAWREMVGEYSDWS